MNSRCFLISPIGLEDSEVRKHSDTVYRFIVEPAMKACGLQAIRADHLAQPGRISDQMFDEILNDQLCIAVLTGHNPNVFYELAVAQAAGRPVILLIEKGEELPFDVKDMRCVYYDLWPEPLVNGVYKEEVVKQIRELEGAGWTMKMPFGEGLSPLGGQRWDDLTFFPKSESYGDSDAWLDLLKDTEDIFEIMGISLRLWMRTRRFSEVLTEKAERGCKVRILLLDVDNPCLPSLINEHSTWDRGESSERVRTEIRQITEVFRDLAEDHGNVEMRQIRTGCPHLQMTRTDQVGVYVPYLYSENTQFSPLWKCASDHPVYALVTREFESLWQANDTVA